MPNDLLLDGNFDLVISDGDLVISESTRQHQALLLLSEKGELRHSPTRGVGLTTWLNDDAPANLSNETKRQFTLDGQTVTYSRIKNGALETDGRYE